MPTNTPSPRLFLLELGFDCEAAPILGTDEQDRIFPLQHALVDVTEPNAPKPAWYTKMRPGDQVSMRLLDISNLEDGTWDPGHRPKAPGPQQIHVRTTDPKDRDVRVSVLLDTPSWQAIALHTGVESPVFSVENQLFVGWDLSP